MLMRILNSVLNVDMPNSATYGFGPGLDQTRVEKTQLFSANRVIRKVSWREGFGPGFEKIVWQALKVEQVSVAIKKHRHKSFEGPEMVKKKICSCVASAPREFSVALSEGANYVALFR